MSIVMRLLMMRLPGRAGSPPGSWGGACGCSGSWGGGGGLAGSSWGGGGLPWLLGGRWWAPLAPGEVVGGKNLSGTAAPAARSAPPPLLFKLHLNPSDFLGWSRQDRIHISQPRKIAAFGIEASQTDCRCHWSGA